MKKNGSLWWLNPVYLYGIISIVPFFAYFISEKFYWLLYGVRSKFVSEKYLLLYIICALLFCIGAKFAKGVYVGRVDDIQSLKRMYTILIRLCFIAYAIWFARFIMAHGFGAFFSFLKPNALVSNVFIFRNHSGRIAGLTSMTEFGVVVAPMAVCFFKQTKNRKYLLHLFALFVLALIRSMLFSERLALLELLVPSIITLFQFIEYKSWYRFIPLIAFVLVFALFGGLEYFRSWSRYYVDHYNGNFFQFIANRLLGYYTIAINTECTYLQVAEPHYYPHNLLEFLWKLPLFDKLPEIFSGGRKLGFNVLDVFGNEEFNNPGGMLVAVKDFGLFGVPFSFLLGRISGALYKSYRQNYLLGNLLYPIFFLCIIEMPRYYYFGNNRAFFVLIGMFIVFAKVRKIRWSK